MKKQNDITSFFKKFSPTLQKIFLDKKNPIPVSNTSRTMIYITLHIFIYFTFLTIFFWAVISKEESEGINNTMIDQINSNINITIDEMLEELKNFDTPSITNVVATYPNSPHCVGLYNPWSENWYTDQTVRCMYPELGRSVGYAVTCVYGLPDPNFSRLSFLDVIDALAA